LNFIDTKERERGEKKKKKRKKKKIFELKTRNQGGGRGCLYKTIQTLPIKDLWV
jgi:hypothetical protein